MSEEADTVIVQGDEGEALTEAELASLLANAHENVPEGAAQFVDPQGNVLTVRTEPLLIATVSSDCLTAAQLLFR